MPSFVQLSDRFRRTFLDRIGDAKQPGRLSVDDDEHHGLAFAAKVFGLPGELVCVDFQLVEQRPVTERNPAPVDISLHAFAG